MTKRGYAKRGSELKIILIAVAILLAFTFAFVLGNNFAGITGRASYGTPEAPDYKPDAEYGASLSCGDIIQTSQNLGGLGYYCPGQTAFFINTSNVTFDCQGAAISGDSTAGTYGFWIYSEEGVNGAVYNVTIKNCRITDFTSAVYFYDVNSSHAINNTINRTSTGIVTYKSNDIFIEDNIIDNSTLYGIHCQNDVDIGINCSIVNNTIHGRSGETEHGIWLQDQNNSKVTDNRIYDVTGYYGGDAGAIFIKSSNNYIANNDITTHETGWSGTAGIYIYPEHNNNTIINNTLVTQSQYGIWVSSSNFNNISDNTISNTMSEYTGYDLYMETSSNNTIYNNIMNGSTDYGIYIINSDNNTFDSNNVTGQHKYGIVLFNSSDYNILQNSYTVNNNRTGIFVKNTLNNKLISNTASNNSASGFYIGWSNNTNITSNTANYNYFAGMSVYESNHNLFDSNTLNSNFIGLALRNSDDNNLTENTANNNYAYGINLFECLDTRINGITTLTYNIADGLALFRTNRTIMSEINASYNNASGLNINLFSNYNNITNSSMIGNLYSGVLVEFFSKYNLINKSNITGNSRYGVELDFYATFNNISYNNLSNNALGNYTATDYSGNNSFVGNVE